MIITLFFFFFIKLNEIIYAYLFYSYILIYSINNINNIVAYFIFIYIILHKSIQGRTQLIFQGGGQNLNSNHTYKKI